MARPKNSAADSSTHRQLRGRRALIKGGLVAVPAMLTLRGRALYAGNGTMGDYTEYIPGRDDTLQDNPYDDPTLGGSQPDTFGR